MSRIVVAGDGFVLRTACDEVPARVEYELTPLGRSFLAPLEATRAWCETHAGALRAARAAHAGPGPLTGRGLRGRLSPAGGR